MQCANGGRKNGDENYLSRFTCVYNSAEIFAIRYSNRNLKLQTSLSFSTFDYKINDNE